MELLRLDPEGWGDSVRRAREAPPYLSLQKAEERIRPLLPVSYRTLARLEELKECPTDGKRQLLAYLYLLILGYEPDDFGLADSEAKQMIDREAVLGRLHLRSRQSPVKMNRKVPMSTALSEVIRAA